MNVETLSPSVDTPEPAPELPVRVAIAKPESIRIRYAVTLFAQFFRLALAFLTAWIVPRALGPAIYGNYNFLQSAASTLRGFLEPSVQQAFFTFSSQDKQSGSLTKLYGLFLLAQMGLLFTLVGLAAFAGLTGLFWPGQQLDQILWVTLLDWAMFFALSLQQLGDSKGITIRPQAILAGVSAISIAGLLALVSMKWLNFYTYVWVNLLTALVSGVALGYLLLAVNRDVCWAGTLHGRVQEHLGRWWRYAAPLIALEYYNPLVSYLSPYLLQVWYGSVEQGYLGLALRWSSIVLVFTSSALSILWREIAHATAAGDPARAIRVYLRFSRMLVFLALVLCLWLSFGSRTLVMALAGPQYEAAIPVLMLMAFYPLAQTYGQINTATMKGVGRTAHYRNLGILQSIPDLLLTYLLLAPPTAPVPGLGLGAIGVAIRMVGYGLLSVQVYEWSNLRFWGLDYSRFLLQKIAAVLPVIACVLLALGGFNYLLQTWGKLDSLWSLALSSCLYFFLVGLVVLAGPEFTVGVSRAEIWAALQLACGRWQAFFSRSVAS